MGMFSVDESDEYCALEEENKRLKKQVESLKKELYFSLEKSNELRSELNYYNSKYRKFLYNLMEFSLLDDDD